MNVTAQCSTAGLISSDCQLRFLDPPFSKLVEYANRKSDLVESAVFYGLLGFCRFDSCLDHLATYDRMVQRLRRLHDTQEIEGSIPSAIT